MIKLKQVHFQITRNCNLRCSFCGQWGKKGFFADSSGTEMTLEDWKEVICQLEKYCEKKGGNICVTVWGGEPLVSPIFDELMSMLKERDFITEVITNGVLIDKHIDVLKSCADRIYVSLDGTAQVHNKIRGGGVFEKVCGNLKSMRHSNITVMSVITKELIKALPDFLNELNELGIRNLYLQDMIGLTTEEINAYKRRMKSAFNIDATDINSWENDEEIRFFEQVEDVLKNADGLNYEVEHKTHSSEKDVHCMSPFCHMHITWNGDVTYCTDFYDFKAGNVKEESIEEIFLNPKSEKYREEIQKGSCPTCNHCSWKNTKFLDFLTD